jgi:hypothetical protein
LTEAMQLTSRLRHPIPRTVVFDRHEQLVWTKCKKALASSSKYLECCMLLATCDVRVVGNGGFCRSFSSGFPDSQHRLNSDLSVQGHW